MMSNTNLFKKYPVYKDSGVDWLGEIPEGWELKKVKNIFQLIIDPAPKNNNYELLSVYTEIGVKPRKELKEKGNKASTTDGYWMVKKGDIIVNKLLAWMGAIGISKYNGVTSPAYDILRSKLPINGDYYHNLFRTPRCVSELKKHSRGIMEMRLRLYFDKFGDIFVPYPSEIQQKTIANYLDKKTTQIDQAIKQKQKLIELLKERQQIIIQNAVTKGINPDVKLKDSGIDWIGDIPEHWGLKVMKYVLKAVGDVDHYMPETINSGIPYIMTGDLKELMSEINLEECKQVSHVDFMKLSKKIKSSKGDVILARYATVGTVSYIDINKDFLVSYSCVTIKPDSDKIMGLFLFYYFKSNSFSQEIEKQINTNTQGNVGINDIRNLKISLPPICEQTTILIFIENQTKQTNKAIKLQQQTIEKLIEYKATLINSAVTGKIKLC